MRLNLNEPIRQIFSNHGVEPIGFAPFDLVRLKGKHPKHDSIKTVIIAAFPYLPPQPYKRTNLCLYARLPDYHRVINTLLTPITEELTARFPGSIFLPFADNSPVREVYAAAIAGLGCIGKNGLLITPEYGSYVFLGGLLTDQELETQTEVPGGCTNCGRCIAACPTGALSTKGFNHTRCLSAITQKKGRLTEEEQAAIQKSGMVWGCDECQLACPMNRSALPSPHAEFHTSMINELTENSLESDFSDRAFNWRGKDVLQRNLKLTKPEK